MPQKVWVENTGRKFDYYPWLVALVVLVSRILTTGPVYFDDGPSHVRAVLAHRFVIEPPGYWLFNHVAGLFANPEKGISLMNWVFSAAGVVVFYYAARLLVTEGVARLGCAVYAATFYAWFSGNVHSTYASQLFFPVLLFLFLFLHRKDPRLPYLVGASCAFAIGAGFRPSDGAFLGLMFVYYLWRYAPRRQAAWALAVAVVLCLGWLLPTILAYRSSTGMGYFTGYIAGITTVDSALKHGATYRSMANVTRFFVPLGVAFWLLALPMLKSLARLRDPHVQLLWLAIAPGAGFFMLVYMAPAPYLNFLTAALLLLAMLEMDVRGARWRYLALAGCLVWNVVFYLAFRPLPGNSLPVKVLDAYSGVYTHYGVSNQWQPNLSDLYKGRLLPPRLNAGDR